MELSLSLIESFAAERPNSRMKASWLILALSALAKGELRSTESILVLKVSNLASLGALTI